MEGCQTALDDSRFFLVTKVLWYDQAMTILVGVWVTYSRLTVVLDTNTSEIACQQNSFCYALSAFEVREIITY